MIPYSMKEVLFRSAALKSLKRIPANDAKRILAKIHQYADNPSSLSGNVKRLQGYDAIRLRVGNWRVIMLDNEVLEIIKIGARGSIYER